jgi:carboxylate-amine ligase
VKRFRFPDRMLSVMVSEFTLGVEEEYQLVDAGTGALRSRARHVLAADWSGEIREELQETTVEVGTAVCRSAAELERELKRLRLQAATAAAVEGLEIVAAGTHPFSRWEGQKRTAGPRYDRLEAEYGRIARDEHNFGMHIHVAVPSERDRIRILNVARCYLPQLLALSCSSPYYEGEDTGYASYRMILWRRWPVGGIPPRLESQEEYGRLAELLLQTGAVGDLRSIYWGLRPHSVYPTLEFRVTDACPRVEDAVAIAALTRALVFAAAEGLVAEERCAGFSASVQDSLLGDNLWRAARWGLDACLVDPGSETGATPMRASLRGLIDRLIGPAEALGDAEAFGHLETLLERGTAADRMRQVYRERQGFRPLVKWLVEETLAGTGMERWHMPREACA